MENGFFYDSSALPVLLSMNGEELEIAWMRETDEIKMEYLGGPVESFADKMVLSTFFTRHMSSTASYYSINDTHTYRYTFEKVK